MCYIMSGQKNISKIIGEYRMITKEDRARQKAIYAAHVAKLADAEARQLVAEHFRRRIEIFEKYDPYRDIFPTGLDGGSPDENRELREETKRFDKAWSIYAEKKKSKKVTL